MNLQREAWPFERDRIKVESRSSFLIEQALHKRGTRSSKKDLVSARRLTIDQNGFQVELGVYLR